MGEIMEGVERAWIDFPVPAAGKRGRGCRANLPPLRGRKSFLALAQAKPSKCLEKTREGIVVPFIHSPLLQFLALSFRCAPAKMLKLLSPPQWGEIAARGISLSASRTRLRLAEPPHAIRHPGLEPGPTP